MLHDKFDQDDQLASAIFKFEIVDDDGRRRTDGRTTDHWYTISSPCERAFGSGELKMRRARSMDIM